MILYTLKGKRHPQEGVLEKLKCKKNQIIPFQTSTSEGQCRAGAKIQRSK